MTIELWSEIVNFHIMVRAREFDYILQDEITTLSEWTKIPYSEMWNWFKSKDFVIAKTQTEAYRIQDDKNEIPF